MTKPKHFLTADIVFGASLVAGFILQYFWPLSFGSWSDSAIHHLIGAPLLLLGGILIVLSKRELQRLGETSEHHVPTTWLVTTGPYHYSRNPLYLGLAVCFCGLSFAINKPWFLILLIPTLLVVQQFMIYPEELYLQATFGDDYQHYKKTVRRWL